MQLRLFIFSWTCRTGSKLAADINTAAAWLAESARARRVGCTYVAVGDLGRILCRARRRFLCWARRWVGLTTFHFVPVGRLTFVVRHPYWITRGASSIAVPAGPPIVGPIPARYVRSVGMHLVSVIESPLRPLHDAAGGLSATEAFMPQEKSFFQPDRC